MGWAGIKSCTRTVGRKASRFRESVKMGPLLHACSLEFPCRLGFRLKGYLDSKSRQKSYPRTTHPKPYFWNLGRKTYSSWKVGSRWVSGFGFRGLGCRVSLGPCMSVLTRKLIWAKTPKCAPRPKQSQYARTHLPVVPLIRVITPLDPDRIQTIPFNVIPRASPGPLIPWEPC